jgi:hypothetical protein
MITKYRGVSVTTLHYRTPNDNRLTHFLPVITK